MALRVTTDEVREIIPLESSFTDAMVTAMITGANVVVTEVCTDSSLDTAHLKEIERWLSAHFCAIRDMRAATEKTGPASISFQYKVDLRLDVTMYGQQAMIIDTSGALARLNKGKKVKMQLLNPDLEA